MASDWRKDLKHLYLPPSDRVVEVNVPEMSFLTVKGKGNPNVHEGFQLVVAALYKMAFTLKFAIKKANPDGDFKVGPLEALWWNTPEGDLVLGRKEDWEWKAMILQPGFVDEPLVETVREVALKKDPDNELLRIVQLEEFQEGRCAQTMHIGPWDQEAATVERISEFIREKGGRRHGKHHEIYMSDPRRVPPEKLKTVVRIPFR